MLQTFHTMSVVNCKAQHVPGKYGSHGIWRDKKRRSCTMARTVTVPRAVNMSVPLCQATHICKKQWWCIFGIMRIIMRL